MGLFGSNVHHYHKTETRTVPYEKTVTEHRAPTDESIRLYGEMAEKVMNSIVADVKLEVAGIEVTGTLFNKSIMMMGEGAVWKFRYLINGREFHSDVNFDRYEFRGIQHNSRVFPKAAAEKLIAKLSESIARIILSDEKSSDILRDVME